MFHVFDKVKVRIMLDASNLQHQKIRMALVEPQVWSKFRFPDCGGTNGTDLGMTGVQLF